MNILIILHPILYDFFRFRRFLLRIVNYLRRFSNRPLRLGLLRFSSVRVGLGVGLERGWWAIWGCFRLFRVGCFMLVMGDCFRLGYGHYFIHFNYWHG